MKAAATDIQLHSVANAYDRWAPVYDLTFGAVFRRGRSASIEAAERIGGRILEVGVGTGISLPQYSRRNRIFGVDISEEMLRKAHKRVDALGLEHVEGLEVMDAEKLNFPDGAFDVVVAQYVVTAVPNPEKALDEFARVLRPGGEIVVATRIGAEAGLRRNIEHMLQPVVRKLGWRTEFSFDRYRRWVATRKDIRIAESRALPPLGHFYMIRFEKIDPAANASAAA